MEERLEPGTEVTTAFGPGKVVGFREEDSIYIVSLSNSATGYFAQLARKKKLFEMNDLDKLALGKRYREEGNMFFKFGDFSLALTKYELAKVYFNHSELKPVEEMHVLWNNVGLTLMRSGLFFEAVQTLTEALKFATGKQIVVESKSLFFRAQAHRKLSNLEASMEDLVSALKLQPRSKPIRDELEAVREENKLAKQVQALLFKDVFNKPDNAKSVIVEEAKSVEEIKPVEEAEPMVEDVKPVQETGVPMVAIWVGLASAVCLVALLWGMGAKGR
ncbi:hypothetical protein BASA81_012891 [Batrachochytrium salamandrivorans]|nr:hypothetical protein BASA81_012891 [Batrachochytrium salamandrivorans]